MSTAMLFAAAFTFVFAAALGAAFTALPVSPSGVFTAFGLAGAFVFFTVSVLIESPLKSRLVRLPHFNEGKRPLHWQRTKKGSEVRLAWVSHSLPSQTPPLTNPPPHRPHQA